MQEKKISIVIPVGKRRKNELKTLIPSLKAQTYPNYEIIVEDEGTCGHNRNKGARRAKGDILLFCDSDQVLTPNVLDLINRTLNRDQILVYNKAGAFMAIYRNQFIPFDEHFKISEDIPWFNMMEKKGMKIVPIVENRNRDKAYNSIGKSFFNAIEWQMIPEMNWFRIILSSVKTIIFQIFVIFGTIVGLILKIKRKLMG